MNRVIITDIEDLRRWEGAILSMRFALKNGYEGVYRIASATLHEVADKYNEPKSLLDILLGL